MSCSAAGDASPTGHSADLESFSHRVKLNTMHLHLNGIQSKSTTRHFLNGRFAAPLLVIMAILALFTVPARAETDGESAASNTAAQMSLAAGEYHSCAIDPGHTLYCWGHNFAGQIGNGTLVDSTIPVAVTGIGPTRQVATKYNHTCAVTTAGAAFCWGKGSHGQIGNGTIANEFPSPTPVTGFSSGVRQIATGFNHSCLVTDSGAVYCWGNNQGGQLGNGTTTDSSTPVLAIASGARSIQTGYYVSCAIMLDHTAKCWGYNYYDELGFSTSRANVLSPSTAASLGNVSAITDLYGTVCAIATADESVKCVGNGMGGHLGNGASSNSASPVQPTGLQANVQVVSATEDHICAMTTTGDVYCWAGGADGMIGNGSTNDSDVPVRVTGLPAPAVAMTTGYTHTIALLQDGTLWCWGSNADGQFGDGTTNNSSVPVRCNSLDLIDEAASSSPTTTTASSPNLPATGTKTPIFDSMLLAGLAVTVGLVTRKQALRNPG